MHSVDFTSALDSANTGQRIYDLICELYPICRSISGNGVRQSLEIVKTHIPRLEVHEVPTGTQVFDWTIPKEWNIKDAYIKDSTGERVVDFRQCNLHVLNYSIPIKRKISIDDLKPHLFTVPEHPDWIPYRTSYYVENWGFCLSHTQFLQLRDEEYDVSIESSLTNGHLTYGDYYIKGKTDAEFLFSVHVCHPSLANDNLSSVALATLLAKELSTCSLKYSYRFLFIPGTIGSIAWLSLNESQISRIRHGLVLACVGDSGKITYKKSRQSSCEIDRAVAQVLKDSGDDHAIIDFSPYGYDERQFCSPGFNLPVGCFMRTPHGQFPEYHTSADNLEFVQPRYLADSFVKILAIIQVVEGNATYLNLNPKCEPQLGKRALYGSLGGQTRGRLHQLAMLWVLNLSDGNHTLLHIAEKSGLAFCLIKEAADILHQHHLLTEHILTPA